MAIAPLYSALMKFKGLIMEKLLRGSSAIRTRAKYSLRENSMIFLCVE
jgi:hypothetical protein